jgi:hypothetical protein
VSRLSVSIDLCRDLSYSYFGALNASTFNHNPFLQKLFVLNYPNILLISPRNLRFSLLTFLPMGIFNMNLELRGMSVMTSTGLYFSPFNSDLEGNSLETRLPPNIFAANLLLETM